MDNINSTFMKSRTFTGNGSVGACLIVEPTFEESEYLNGDNEYENDAIALANFLESVFCGQTLKALKKLI